MSGSEHIRLVAHISIRRMLLFYVSGALTVFMGFSENLELALRATAIMFTVLTGLLGLRAWWAPRVDYGRSAPWKFLAWVHRVPERHLQRVLSVTMRQVCLAYADLACIAAMVFWLLLFTDEFLSASGV